MFVPYVESIGSGLMLTIVPKRMVACAIPSSRIDLPEIAISGKVFGLGLRASNLEFTPQNTRNCLFERLLPRNGALACAQEGRHARSIGWREEGTSLIDNHTLLPNSCIPTMPSANGVYLARSSADPAAHN